MIKYVFFSFFVYYSSPLELGPELIKASFQIITFLFFSFSNEIDTCFAFSGKGVHSSFVMHIKQYFISFDTWVKPHP